MLSPFLEGLRSFSRVCVIGVQRENTPTSVHARTVELRGHKIRLVAQWRRPLFRNDMIANSPKDASIPCPPQDASTSTLDCAPTSVPVSSGAGGHHGFPMNSRAQLGRNSFMKRRDRCNRPGTCMGRIHFRFGERGLIFIPS